MQLELQALKHMARSSIESTCFNVKVYVNDKPFAIIKNNGKGGKDNLYRDSRCSLGDYYRLQEEISTYFEGLSNGLNFEKWYTTELLKGIRLQFLRTQLTNKFRVGYQLVAVKDGKLKYFASSSDRIELREEGYIILNDLPFGEAFKKYIALSEN